MLPLFRTIANQRAEISTLKKQLGAANKAIKKAEQLADEAVQASEATIPALKRTQGELQEARTDLERTKLEMVGRAAEHKVELEKKCQEVTSLHDRLQALKAQVCLTSHAQS